MKKSNLDKFYTKKDIAKYCLSKVDLYKFDKIIEPSAGNGSFSSQISNCIALDLLPECNDIIKQDFYCFDYSKLYGNILVIGNPPFGRQSSDAIKFIKYAANFANTIAFILPISFKKNSLQIKVPKKFHLKYSEDLPLNSFEFESKDYPLYSVFQIWEKEEYERHDINFLKQMKNNFDFVDKNSEHDFSFRRVGGTAGCISLDTKDKCIHSHYFIKVKDRNKVNEVIEKLSFTEWNDMNSTGPKSISPHEIWIKISGSFK